jgi:hypothetical protein
LAIASIVVPDRRAACNPLALARRQQPQRRSRRRSARRWQLARRVPRTGAPVVPIKPGFACRPSSTPYVVAIEGWLAEQPQLTALAIVGRLSEKDPEEFGTKQHSIVQRLLRALRRKAAAQLVAEEPLSDATTATPWPGSVDGSGYVGPDPPTAPPTEQVWKASCHGRSVDIGSTAARAPAG